MAEKTKSTKRLYRGQEKIDHDLFKLTVSKMVKDTSWSDVPNFEYLEHCHMFHSVDNQGNKQETSNPVGGHCHVITVTGEEDGIPTVTCGPAVKQVQVRTPNGYQKKFVPITFSDGTVDDHTHDMEYKRSEKIEIQQLNPEFIKAQAMIESKKPQPVAGIITK
jgi:hypothetical protein